MTKQTGHSNKIKTMARGLGFDSCGISKATYLEEDVRCFTDYIEKDFHGDMKYLENNFEKRMDPRLLVEGAKSVISVVLNYYPPVRPLNDNFVVSKYAFGKDYHFVLKEKLHELLQQINIEIGMVSGRAFVDSAPVLEKRWAQKSGIGWIGKNSCLIIPNAGSFYFIGELIVDIELEPDLPMKNFCANCTRCIDACPTKAIVAPGVIDSRKCISYLSIEYKDDLPLGLQKQFGRKVFGCDTCQDVCPWNKKSTFNTSLEFIPKTDFIELEDELWLNLSKEDFKRLFKKTALERTKFKGLLRNIDFIKNNPK